MPARKSSHQEHVEYHKDGSIWAKGQMANRIPTGYWEWFRKAGTKMRSGYFENGQQTGKWTTYDQSGKVYKVTQLKPRRRNQREASPAIFRLNPD